MHQAGEPSATLGSIGKALTEAETVAVEATNFLRQRGVQTAIVGGLAVAHHGYARATSDVDLMVVESHRVTGTPLGIPGVSLPGWGVPVDCLFIDPAAKFLREAVVAASQQSPPVLAVEPLMFLKLSAGRAKDFADVVELLKVDMTRVPRVRAYLARHAGAHQRERFERAYAAAYDELGGLD
jgi:hypothetical protein